MARRLSCADDDLERLASLYEGFSSASPELVAKIEALERQSPFAAIDYLQQAADPATFESWQHDKAIEADEAIRKARDILNGDRDDGWKPVAGAVAELAYWTMLGDKGAEGLLLEKLRSDVPWVRTEIDAALRKSWGIPTHADATIKLDEARAALVAGDAQRALSVYDSIVGTLPEFADGWRKRGQVYHRALRRYDEALADYKKAVDCNPSNYVALLDYGTLLWREKRASFRLEAREALERAAYINPSLRDQVDAVLLEDD